MSDSIDFPQTKHYWDLRRIHLIILPFIFFSPVYITAVFLSRNHWYDKYEILPAFPLILVTITENENEKERGGEIRSLNL
jgi:hypothetical protein